MNESLLIAVLIGVINVAAQTVQRLPNELPPQNGTFFYASFDQGIPGVVTEEDYNEHYVNIITGDKNTSLNLWVTTSQPNLALFSEDCSLSMCNVPQRYKESSQASTINSGVVATDVLRYAQKQSVQNNRYSGDIIKDEIGFELDMSIETKVTSPILKVKSIFPNLKSVHDGYMGLAPWKRSSDKSTNFLFNLKQNGFIDHQTVAFYTSLDQGNSSIIKFGGWDPSAIEEGKEMVTLQTLNTSTWALNLTYANIASVTLQQTADDGSGLQLNQRIALFEPMVPYVYLPQAAFDDVSRNIGLIYTDENSAICSHSQCYWNKQCSEVDQSLFSVQLTVSDPTGIEIPINLPNTTYFVEGERVGGQANQCFLAVFGHANGMQDVIYLGNRVMSEIYTVFDMSPRTEYGRYYNQIGLAPAKQSKPELEANGVGKQSVVFTPPVSLIQTVQGNSSNEGSQEAKEVSDSDQSTTDTSEGTSGAASEGSAGTNPTPVGTGDNTQPETASGKESGDKKPKEHNHKTAEEIKELLMYIGGGTVCFLLIFGICYCIKKRNEDRTFKSQSIYVRDMDEELTPGEKPKKLRLISAHGEQTGVLVTSNTISSSSMSGKKSYPANESIQVGDDVFNA